MSATPQKTVLVTGAARRLGRELALSFAREGLNVAVHYFRSEKEALGLVEELQGIGVRASAHAADLTCFKASEGLIERVVQKAGSLDVLVNNAAVYRRSRLADVSMETLKSDVRVNGFSPLILSRSFAQKVRRGVIVNLLDARMVDYDPKHVSYHLSKQMLFQSTRLLALELAPGIRVNAVAPGLILPPADGNSTYLNERRWSNPLHEVGAAQAVTDAVRLLVSSDFITGQVIFVDGGRHLKGSVY